MNTPTRARRWRRLRLRRVPAGEKLPEQVLREEAVFASADVSADASMVPARARGSGLKRLLLVMGVSLVIGAIAAVGVAIATRNSPKSPTGLAALIARQSQSSSDSITTGDLIDAGDSPAATVLHWWQDLQLGLAPRRIRALYAPSAGVTVAAVRREVSATRYLFLLTKPVVADVATGTHTAEVFALILNGKLDAASARSTVTPYIFHLARIGVRWLLSDDAYMNAKATYLRRLGVR